MPFTQEEFYAVFAAYNAALWPAQPVAYLAGLAATALLFRRSRLATAVALWILAAMWLVNGAAYHWTFFAEVNPVARVFGAVFVLEALLLALAPAAAPGFRLVPRRDVRTVAGLGLVLFAAAIYPAWGRLAGHVWPATPSFGIAPCPTTVFTVGLLLLGQWPVARWLLVIPGLWAIVGGSAALLLGVPQDTVLIGALLVTLVFAWGWHRGAAFARHRERSAGGA